MPSIPTYFATEQMETSRLPRAPMEIADTGQGLEAAGLKDLGEAFSSLGKDFWDDFIETRSETQFLEGASQWERAHTEFFIDLKKDGDFENYGTKYKAFAKEQRRNIIRKGLTTPARRYLEKYITSQQLASEKRVGAEFLDKQKDWSRASAIVAVNYFEKALDADGAASAIETARKEGFMSAEEAANRQKSVRANVDWYRGLMLIDSKPGDFLKLLETDPVEFLPNLNPEQKLQLKARATRQLGVMIAQQRDLREQQINTDQSRLMGLA
ncbi:MAG: hypothetical protein HWN68_20815, partial [Desulfobacterales bacterium]|nr:hypothetical protein [Desulfobacterales bacterium]